MSTPESSQGDSARSQEWNADRNKESQPLPYSHQKTYSGDVERQIDLNAAEQANIARAAGELGITSSEWTALRKELGRSPGPYDVKK